MKTLFTAITLATLIASPAFATPVDAITVGAALLVTITGTVIARYELAQLGAAAVVARTK